MAPQPRATLGPARDAVGKGTLENGANGLRRLSLSAVARYTLPMAVRDLTSERLFLDAPLSAGAAIVLADNQAHYLLNVLRLGPGDRILVFNGRDGEWQAEVSVAKKRSAELRVLTEVRPQSQGQDLDYVFAPLKRARLDYMVQKAVEMGVSRLRPVLTHRTVAERVNLERMRANAIEAAEQCGVLNVPAIDPVMTLERLIEGWEHGRTLIFCDEAGAAEPPLDVLRAIPHGPVAVLIGPEGGFDDVERQMLLARSFVTPVSLGPRIMRADTAAVAALALVNATRGDWR